MSNNPQYPGLQPLRPPIPGSMDPQRNYGPPMPVQFRTVVPTQQPQQFVPMPAQHYHQPVGPGVAQFNVGMPPQNQQPQFSQPIQQFHPRPSQQLPLPSQAIPMPLARPNMQTSSESMLPQPDSQAPNGYTPGLGGPGMPSYTFASSPYGQVQNNYNSTSQYQHVPQIQAPVGSLSQSITPGTTPQSNNGQPTVTTVMPSATIVQPHLAKVGSSEWIEHTSATGRRFYYNKRTKLSSWEKPFELMTPIERVDASTNWKEFTSPDGRKYYYNKITKESKWLIPEELKLAREQVEKATGLAAPVTNSMAETILNIVSVVAQPAFRQKRFPTMPPPPYPQHTQSHDQECCPLDSLHNEISPLMTPGDPAVSNGSLTYSHVRFPPSDPLDFCNVNSQPSETNTIRVKQFKPIDAGHVSQLEKPSPSDRQGIGHQLFLFNTTPKRTRPFVELKTAKAVHMLSNAPLPPSNHPLTCAVTSPPFIQTTICVTQLKATVNAPSIHLFFSKRHPISAKAHASYMQKMSFTSEDPMLPFNTPAGHTFSPLCKIWETGGSISYAFFAPFDASHFLEKTLAVAESSGKLAIREFVFAFYESRQTPLSLCEWNPVQGVYTEKITSLIPDGCANSSNKTTIADEIGATLIRATLAVLLYQRHKSILEAQHCLSNKHEGILNSNIVGSPANLSTGNEIKKASRYFSSGTLLGIGGYSDVSKGILHGTVVAIKCSKLGNAKGTDQLLAEVRILCPVNHRNIVDLLGCCVELEQTILVYECLENVTLIDHLQDQMAKTRALLSWNHCLLITCDTPEGLDRLPCMAVPLLYHRNVQSNNILLDIKMHANVSDFGVSRLAQTDRSDISICSMGILVYLDSEYYGTYQLNVKSDDTSFGVVVLLELLSFHRAMDFIKNYIKPEEARLLVQEDVRNTTENIYDLTATLIQKAHKQHMFTFYVRIRNGQQWNPGGLLAMTTAVKWSQFMQWDPGKFIQWSNFYNLEDKVGLDGVGNVRNNTLGPNQKGPLLSPAT